MQQQVQRWEFLLFYISYQNEAPEDISVLCDDFSTVTEVEKVAPIKPLDAEKRFNRPNPFQKTFRLY